MARESKRKRDERRFGRLSGLAESILEAGLGPGVDLKGDREAIEFGHDIANFFIEELEDATIVRIDNVVDYVNSVYADRTVEVASEVPNWRPPFQSIFLEDRSRQGVSRGILLSSGNEARSLIADLNLGGEFDTEYADVLLLRTVLAIDGRPLGPTSISLLAFDEYGKAIGQGWTQITFGKFMSESQFGFAEQMTNSDMFVAGLSLSFMHCKNVELCPVEPNAGINKIRCRSGMQPFLRYHTINIEPMKMVLRTEGGVEANGLKKALHICRGHFATYTKEKPLFGHFTGTVWKPCHVRGSSKHGVVLSDYNVNLPKP